jgi:hypothetical protein
MASRLRETGLYQGVQGLAGREMGLERHALCMALNAPATFLLLR